MRPHIQRLTYRALKEMGGVKNLYHIFGNHDFLLILEAESMNSLNKLLNKIEEINFVCAVKTVLVGPTGWLGTDVCRIKNPSFPAA